MLFAKVKYLVFALIFFVGFGVWTFFVAPAATRIPSNFTYQYDVNSADDFYNEINQGYQGPQPSITKFTYDVASSGSKGLSLNVVFDVKTPEGKQIILLKRLYGIDPVSGAHVAGMGDRDRSGYLFAPRNLKEGESFTYWHVNYDAPAQMQYVSREAIEGVEVYKYETQYAGEKIDQTKNLEFLPNVGVTRGVVLDPYLQVWVEPTTGMIVKYVDDTIAYYYDLKTGERIAPWNHFTNKVTDQSAENLAQLAYSQKIQNQFFEDWIPLAMLILGLIFLIIFFLGPRISSLFLIKQRSYALSALAVFAITMSLVLGVWFFIKTITIDQKISNFENKTNQITAYMQSRMDLYINVVYGAQGLFAASKSVEEAEWSSYIDALDAPKNFSGISSLSYVSHIKKSEVKDFPYKIFPENDKENYYPLTYSKTFVGIAAATSSLGFDFSSEPKRALTLATAIDSAKPVSTPAVPGLTNSIPIVSVYVPVYKNDLPHETISERRENIAGIVSAGFRVERLFADLASNPVFDKNIGIQVYDGEGESRTFLYDNNKKNIDSPLERSANIIVAGRIWHINFSAPNDFGLNNTDKYAPHATIVFGSLFSFILALLIYYLFSSRQRAVVFAEKATKDLREAKAKDDAILANIGDGVAVANTKGELIYWNAAAENILGMKMAATQQEGWEKTYGVFYDDEVTPMPGEKQALALALKGEKVTKMEEFIRNAGIPQGRHISVTAQPIYLDDKTLFGGVAIFRDMTKEKDIDKEKTEFVSLASHQLKTPIGSINWNMEMMIDGDYGPISDKQKDILQETYIMSQRMNDLVNALLNISRIELGVFIIEPAPTDWVKLCDEVLVEMKPRLISKGHQLTKDFGANLPLVPADVKLLRVIFQNFISNAIKYTPEHGKVSISLKVDNGNIVFSVANNGESIPEAEQEKIFGKMFRASNAQVQDPDGNGLGLYVVKKIVENAGGKIWFTSKKGEDTVFACSIPLSGMIAKSGTRELS